MRRHYKLRPLVFTVIGCAAVIILLTTAFNSDGSLRHGWNIFKPKPSLVFNLVEDDEEEREAREMEWYIRHARPYIPRQEIEQLLFDGVQRAQPKLFDEELLDEVPETLHDRVEEILRKIPLHKQKKLFKSFPRPGEPNGNIIKLYPPDDFEF